MKTVTSYIKTIVAILYIMTVAGMGCATFVEKTHGTAFVSENIYGAWWFSALWALLTAAGIVYIIVRRVRRASVLALHLSFVVILAGALLTHLTSTRGMMELMKGVENNIYFQQDSHNALTHTLPFSLRLKDFRVDYHAGTMAPSDYVSTFEVNDNGTTTTASVSMNKVYSHRGIRFYQSGYDGDMVYLTVNSDPWGIPVTYCGYAMLFLSLIWMLIDPRGRFRQLLRMSSKMAMIGILLIVSISANAQRTLPREEAGRLGKVYILYNDRICPLQTYAMDFTKKLYGKQKYGEFTAEQVLAGFIFYPEDWKKEKLIRVKSAEVRERYSLDKYVSVRDLMRDGYVFGTALQESYMGQHDKLHQEVMKLDDRLSLIMSLTTLEPLKLFPYSGTWYSPADNLPREMEAERIAYINEIIPSLRKYCEHKSWNRFSETTEKLHQYQLRYGAEACPSTMRMEAELWYNAIPFVKILFMLCLTVGFVSLIRSRRIYLLSVGTLAVAWLALTVCLSLRWIVSGNVPMANGFETMMTVAWMMMLAGFLLSRRFHIAVTFALLMSGFALLVSHLSQMDPQIGHLMPVLSSPLLTIHVSIIMTAYALLALTFLSSLWGLLVKKECERMHILSELLLYPAMACLGIGIFVGAIWANVSWGTYWSWDPKETWALITFMIYAIPFHKTSLPAFQNGRRFHLFMIIAFLSVLMTYFGVNYVLGGMHSYA